MIPSFLKKSPHVDPNATKQVDTSINVTSVCIPKYRVKGNFVEYVIECTRISTTWQIYRRYQQFKALHAQLTSLCPMGTPYHCELGVVPVLCGSSWTEVTNQSPELVEKRRRFLEIYLQQLLVPKNLFYAAKTALFAFLHDGEVPVLYKSRANRPLPGLAAVAEYIADGEDDDDVNTTKNKQVIGANTAHLQAPDSLVADSIPDFSASNQNKTHGGEKNEPMSMGRAKGVPMSMTKAQAAEEKTEADPQPAEADKGNQPATCESGEAEAPVAPPDGPKERCTNCGFEQPVDYDLEEWQSYGRCERCNNFTNHKLILPDGEPVTPSPLVPKCSSQDHGKDDEVVIPPPEPGEVDESDPAAEKPNCAGCGQPFSLFLRRYKCHFCNDVFCSYCTEMVRHPNAEGEVRACARCRSMLERHQASVHEVERALQDKASMVSVPTESEEKPVVRTDLTPNDFELITTLGRGTFGKVIKVRCKQDNVVYAMKVLSKGVIHKRRMIDYIKEEKTIMSLLPPHPFVVSLHFAFQTDQHVYFILDFLPGGELYSHIYPHRSLREPDARFYIAEVVLALEHIHKYDVVHRDLKPENIVLDGEGHVKITDFGLARSNFSRSRRRSFVGSAEYLAPETIQGDVQTKALDWWSVGVMLYEMLSGVAPFNAPNNNDVYHAILHKKLDFSKFSPHAQSLLQRLLEKDPRQRLVDPSRIKQHPFFSGIDWDAMFNMKIKPPFSPDLQNNDTKYFNKDFTSEWATIQRNCGNSRQTLDGLTKRFSNFVSVPDAKGASPAPQDSSESRAVLPSVAALSVELVSPNAFVGVWRLLRVEMKALDGKISYPWGSEVIGMLVYCGNGMFSMQISPLKRPKFKNATNTKITKDEMADAYLGYVAMFGTYEVIPGRSYIIHNPTASLCPNLVNSPEKRFFEVTESCLTLTTQAVSVEEGIVARTCITWERVC